MFVVVWNQLRRVLTTRLTEELAPAYLDKSPVEGTKLMLLLNLSAYVAVVSPTASTAWSCNSSPVTWARGGNWKREVTWATDHQLLSTAEPHLLRQTVGCPQVCKGWPTQVCVNHAARETLPRAGLAGEENTSFPAEFYNSYAYPNFELQWK